MDGNVGYHKRHCCSQHVVRKERELRAQTMTTRDWIICATACAAYLSPLDHQKLESY